MNRTTARLVRLSLGLVLSTTLSLALEAQVAGSSVVVTSVPTDWSHSHLIFARPHTAAQLARVSADARYQQQVARRGMRLMAPMPATNPVPVGVAPQIARPGFVTSDAARELDPRISPDPPMNSGTPMLQRSPDRSNVWGAPVGRGPFRPTPLPPVLFRRPDTTFHRDWAENMGTGASAGVGNFPAKYSFNTHVANCGSAPTPDYVVYSTGLTGLVNQASIVAFDNLYSGCTTSPSIYWAYNTAGQILTSPILSQDGTQVAFVQTVAGAASLVVLRWVANPADSITLPETLVPLDRTLYLGCTAPCMTTLPLTDALTPANDTTSSVFYDYSSDTAWVGDASGWLHKFTGVFKGTPTESTTGGFPVQVNTAGRALSSPVYDFATAQVFVGDVVVSGVGGILYRVDATNGTVTASTQLDFGTGIVEGPVVDSTNGYVYVFASSDGTSLCTLGTSACAGVYQLSTTFTPGDSGSEATAGTSVALGVTPNPMYIGAFDTAYYNSPDGTGNLYVCGNTGQNPGIYQIPVSSGILTNGTAVVALASASFSPACSPITDLLNPNLSGGATERLFVSVQNNGVASACGSGGCILNFVDTPWQPATVYQVGQQILDIHLNIEQVTTAGTSGGSVSFGTTAGATKTDGAVHWINQGALSAAPLSGWTATTVENKAGSRIIDSNGNIEAVTKTGTTGSSTPTWSLAVGGATTGDGTVNWINVGKSLVSALPAAGGTSGIIIDNTVVSGTLAGTSQVYFTTLSNQTCATSGGTGGCAVQASQPGLN